MVTKASCGERTADLCEINTFPQEKAVYCLSLMDLGEMRRELEITTRWLRFISVLGGGVGMAKRGVRNRFLKMEDTYRQN